MSDLNLPLVEAASYGGVFTLPVHIRVVHSTEGPMSRGNARALARNWFGTSQSGTSAHDIFDPSEGVKMVPDNHIAWHVGPGGNSFTRGSEHCAYVRYTTAQWLSADGQEMLDRSARYNAAAAHRDGVLPRWLSLTQLARKEPGFCTHNDIRLVFGGTTHSDPGPNFPYAWYMQRLQMYYNGLQEDPVNANDVNLFWNKEAPWPEQFKDLPHSDQAPSMMAYVVGASVRSYAALQEVKRVAAQVADCNKKLTEIRDLLKPATPPA